jgi:predicted Zn-dependent protease
VKKKLLIFLSVFIILSLIPISFLYADATSIKYIGAVWGEKPTVYITLQKGVDASYKTAATSALNDWNVVFSSGSYTPLTEAPTKKNPADITITIKGNTGAVLGSTKLSASSGIFTKVTITVASHNAMGKSLDIEDFKNILRHEFGHALGLGHANDNGTGDKDLMYPYYDYIEIGSKVPVSNFDKEALDNLYRQDGFGGDILSPIPQMYP